MKLMSAVLVGAAAIVLSTAAQAQVTLKASHQFPGGKGDIRDDMVQMIAKEVGAANVGTTIQVYPGASLFKPNDQWNAMVNGQLDITLFPLDYASGKAPVFSATLMPGLIRNQDRAKRVNDSQFMKDMRAEIENDFGSKVSWNVLFIFSLTKVLPKGQIIIIFLIKMEYGPIM